MDDYSMYGHLSDEELLQIAVERSLADKLFPDQRTSSAASSSSSSCPAQMDPNPRGRHQDSSRHQLYVPSTPPHVTSDPPTALSRLLLRAHKTELSPLQTLILHGDAEALMDLVKQGSGGLTEPNIDGWIALHEAAYYGQLQCVRILSEAHPDSVNSCTVKNQTALWLAASRGHISCVDFLLKHGVDINVADKNRDTPLFKACEHPNEAIVDLLLRSGSQVNRPCSQAGTALHEACRHGELNLCRMLLKAGASLKVRNIYGIQPLFVAAQHGHGSIIHLFAEEGADVNGQAGDGASPLYEACKNGHASSVEALLSRKADANRATKSNLLPLHIAVQNNHKRIVSMLIPVTSTVRLQRSGISPLHIAADKNWDDILELLIESGFDVDAKLSDEWSKMYEDRRSTALYFSVYNKNLEAAEMLLKAGANPNLDIFNPLLIAVRLTWMDMATLLLNYGADVNAQISTQPSSFPSVILLGMESLNMLKLLLNNGCDAKSCFDCRYGQQPHPAEEMPAGEGAPPQQPIQFCEVVSSVPLCQIIGPIISLLLNYVPHVRLCSRLLEALEKSSDWAQIQLQASPPHSLMELCRWEIRCLVGVRRLRLLHILPLPPRVIRFLHYEVHCPFA